MTPASLRDSIETLARSGSLQRDEVLPVVQALLVSLESGSVRAAEPVDGGWRVHGWVKEGILLAFRVGVNATVDVPPVFHFRDRDTLATLDPSIGGRNVRIVPGGTTVRRGAYLGTNVVIMPPAYVNVGAWIGAGSMIDSHALVGSCAQVGERVHLSAGAQIGGVLEPIGAMPVIVEDDVFIGGGAGIFEGTRVGSRAVVAAGVVLTRSVPLYDLARETVHRSSAGGPLNVPPGAVVVPGSRPVAREYGRNEGIHLQTPVIVKYRDPSTDAASALEEALR